MIVLSNGYKKPETGDFGDVWFPALEDNIERVNSHDHDGTDSNKIPSSSMEAVNITVTSGEFAAFGGRFRAMITLSNFTVDTSHISFRDPTTRETAYLEIEYITSNSFYVYTNFVQDFIMVLS